MRPKNKKYFGSKKGRGKGKEKNIAKDILKVDTIVKIKVKTDVVIKKNR